MTDYCSDVILINDLRNIGLTQQWYFILSLTVIVIQSTFVTLFVYGSLFTLLFGDILVNSGNNSCLCYNQIDKNKLSIFLKIFYLLFQDIPQLVI